jgi:hypothetical protein
MTGREEYNENNAGRSIGSSRNREVTEAETAASTAEFSAVSQYRVSSSYKSATRAMFPYI